MPKLIRFSMHHERVVQSTRETGAGLAQFAGSPHKPFPGPARSPPGPARGPGDQKKGIEEGQDYDSNLVILPGVSDVPQLPTPEKGRHELVWAYLQDEFARLYLMDTNLPFPKGEGLNFDPGGGTQPRLGFKKPATTYRASQLALEVRFLFEDVTGIHKGHAARVVFGADGPRLSVFSTDGSLEARDLRPTIPRDSLAAGQGFCYFKAAADGTRVDVALWFSLTAFAEMNRTIRFNAHCDCKKRDGSRYDLTLALDRFVYAGD